MALGGVSVTCVKQDQGSPPPPYIIPFSYPPPRIKVWSSIVSSAQMLIGDLIRSKWASVLNMGVNNQSKRQENTSYTLEPAERFPLTDECKHYIGKKQVPWDIQK